MFSSLPPARPNAGLLQLWKLRNVILCSSHYALEEARINLSDGAQRRRLMRLSRKIEFFDAPLDDLPVGVSLPEKDIPILLAAMEAQAAHLITGEVRHFGPYFGKEIEGILVLAPSDYLQTRRKH
jgi:uncharacterized protein